MKRIRGPGGRFLTNGEKAALQTEIGTGDVDLVQSSKQQDGSELIQASSMGNAAFPTESGRELEEQQEVTPQRQATSACRQAASNMLESLGHRHGFMGVSSAAQDLKPETDAEVAPQTRGHAVTVRSN